MAKGYDLKWFDSEVIAEISKVKKSSLRKIGQKIARDARALCPVGVEVRGTAKSGDSRGQTWSERTPGSLKKSIRYKITKKGDKVQIIAGDKQVFYARFVEFGTERTLAQPFIRPAMMKNQSMIEAAFKDALK